MPVTVQIDGVGKVQLDDSFKGLSAADQQATVDEIANHPSAQAVAPGPQPSLYDRAIATPLGRGIHDAVLSPLSSLENLMGASVNTSGNGGPLLSAPQTIGGKALQRDAANAEGSYQASLANNRNTPGYAAARSLADKIAPITSGGFADSITAPVNAAAAGLSGLITGGLDQANANADAQTAKQTGYAQQHPILSTAGGVVGGLATGAPTKALGIAGALPKQAAQEAVTIPSIADLKAASQASYKQLDDAGISVSSDAMNHLADSLEDKIGARLDPTLHPDATAAFNRVMQHGTDGAKATSTASFTDLDNLRRVVADASGAVKASDRAMARQILDHVDDFVDGLKSEHLDTGLQDQLRADLTSATSAKGQIARQIKSIERNKSGALAARGAAGADTRATYMGLHEQLPQAEATRQAANEAFQAETSLLNAGPQATIDALNSARSNWSKAAQASLIQKQIDKATLKSQMYGQSGMENALRSQFRQLALNDKAMARLSPDVQKAVRDVATGSPTGNVLRALGKYAPHGPMSSALGMGIGGGVGSALGGMMGGVEGGTIGSVALPLLGEAARAGATKVTTAAAKRALDTALLGRSLPRLSAQPAVRLPALTNQSRLPIGLLGMGALQPQQIQ